MVLNVYLDEKRRGWARVRLLPAMPDRAEPAERGAEERVVLRAALAKLPPRQRAVLVLRFSPTCPSMKRRRRSAASQELSRFTSDCYLTRRTSGV